MCVLWIHQRNEKEVNFLEGNFWVTEIPCRFTILTKGHYGTGWLVHKKLCSWRRAFAAAAAISSPPCTPRRAIAAKSGCYFQENCALANGEGLNGVLRVMKTTLLVPHDCKKNHHRPKFCHCVFYSVLRRELSAYSMFWWGMAVKKNFCPRRNTMKFSYTFSHLGHPNRAQDLCSHYYYITDWDVFAFPEIYCP